jgi:orotidine-5'-phosphate decarboxylase
VNTLLPIDSKDRLIVALDFSSAESAFALVKELGGLVSFYKVGIELQLAGGMSPVQRLIGEGKKVFLDLKYFDVPETVRRAVEKAATSGVSLLTVHGNGENSLQAAVRGRGATELKLLAVTVLTSVDQAGITDAGFRCSVEELVLTRARKALEAGCDGVIASGMEAAKLRELLGEDPLIVTPGIRPEGSAKHDQKRTETPGEAIRAGADYIVVGRFITTAPSPRAAAERVLAEMEAGFKARKPAQRI